ncbi:MAG: hypothetical protein GX027_01790 [Clostridiaceae bacterium]|jgi:hypothetical protein|nr:hypothetical protein [Clostridiaceae bacterium]
MKRTAIFIISMCICACLCMNAGQAAVTVTGETEIPGHGPAHHTVAAMSSRTGNKAEELADGIRDNSTGNHDSQASKTGKTIMTLFLITLVVVGLSIYPMLIVSRAAKTRREQAKQDEE